MELESNLNGDLDKVNKGFDSNRLPHIKMRDAPSNTKKIVILPSKIPHDRRVKNLFYEIGVWDKTNPISNKNSITNSKKRHKSLLTERLGS